MVRNTTLDYPSSSAPRALKRSLRTSFLLFALLTTGCLAIPSATLLGQTLQYVGDMQTLNVHSSTSAYADDGLNNYDHDGDSKSDNDFENAEACPREAMKAFGDNIARSSAKTTATATTGTVRKAGITLFTEAHCKSDSGMVEFLEAAVADCHNSANLAVPYIVSDRLHRRLSLSANISPTGTLSLSPNCARERFTQNGRIKINGVVKASFSVRWNDNVRALQITGFRFDGTPINAFDPFPRISLGSTDVYNNENVDVEIEMPHGDLFTEAGPVWGCASSEARLSLKTKVNLSIGPAARGPGR